MTVKLTVTLSDEVVGALKDMAKADGITVTEQLRRAISTEKWLHDVKKRKEQVLVQDQHNTQRLVEFVR